MAGPGPDEQIVIQKLYPDLIDLWRRTVRGDPSEL